MKKTTILILLLVLLMGLSACNNNPDLSESESNISVPFESSTQEEFGVANNSLQPEVPNTTSQLEIAENIIQPIKVADGLYDIGKSLFPNDDTWFSGRVLDDNRLLVTTLAESVIYNYQTGEILHRLPLPVENLGMEHFYSQQQISESNYTITLYDRNLTMLAQHESDRPAIPAIDGKTILYNQYDQRGRIISRNTETGVEKEFDYKTLQPNAGTPYEGGIWVRAFDGECVFFSTTCNPSPGSSGIGALNITTGEGIFSAVLSATESPGFSGIPNPFGKNKAIFWQDGSAFGTDGTYFIIMDVPNTFFTKFDMGTTACRISDNGEFLVAVSSEWKADSSQIVLTNISTYRGDTGTIDGGSFELVSGKDFGIESPISSDYGGSFSGISISDDGKYICFSGVIEEAGSKRQTLFMCEMN